MKETTNFIYDVCIVGSGAGGATCAYELTKAGLNVILLESGNSEFKSVSSNILKYANENFYDSSMQAIFGNSTITTIINRKIGGTTEINSAILKNAPKHILESWSKLFPGPEIFISKMNQFYNEIDEEINPQTSSPLSLGLNNSIIEYGLRKLNWESSGLPRAVKSCNNTGNCLTTCPDNQKNTMFNTYIKWAVENGLTIVENCEVERIKREKPLEIYCKQSEIRKTIKANKVIISAGIFGSPKILKNSKIKNNQIGSNLQMHLGIALLGKFYHPIDCWNSATQGWSSSEFIDKGMVIESLSMHPGLIATKLPGAGEDFLKELTELRNFATLTIKISSKTKGKLYFFKNKIFPFFYLKKQDIEDLKFGLTKCSEVLFNSGAYKVNLGIKGFSPFITKDKIDSIMKLRLKAKDFTLICNHTFGTCSIGKVVNHNGEVYGEKDIYVSDTSIIPTAMANNPQKTIMALSKLISKNIIEELHGKN